VVLKKASGGLVRRNLLEIMGLFGYSVFDEADLVKQRLVAML
jgi:hypothetical protein